ncbi:MAG TPA: zf-TFIIB domain-containing protein [Actinomycetes bacterium]|jgi:Zn-finger nucleic acid-binding protein|nr:zf-TFIIB domain-containing protein [Actinomycetes bacterium]
MRCPVCDVRLVETDRQGVEIDHCPRCRGVWLDRGELDKLIERAGEGRSERDHVGGGGRGRRRRGFLEDLFDSD